MLSDTVIPYMFRAAAPKRLRNRCDSLVRACVHTPEIRAVVPRVPVDAFLPHEKTLDILRTLYEAELRRGQPDWATTLTQTLTRLAAMNAAWVGTNKGTHCPPTPAGGPPAT